MAFLRQQVEAPTSRAVEETPTFQVTPCSTMRSPTPSRSKISSAASTSTIARLPHRDHVIVVEHDRGGALESASSIAMGEPHGAGTDGWRRG